MFEEDVRSTAPSKPRKMRMPEARLDVTSGTWGTTPFYGYPTEARLDGYGEDARSKATSKTWKTQDNRVRLHPYTATGTVFMPTLVFIAVFYVRALDIHYASSVVSLIICLLLLLAILGSCCHHLVFKRRRFAVFLWLSCFLAWISGFYLGDHNYHAYFKRYFDFANLQQYKNVDPSRYMASQFIAAGIIEFSIGSHLDLEKSASFKNGDIYCIAPVVHANASQDASSIRYDFWAVGKNCCSAHSTDYHCGDYQNPRVNKGLRLMHDGERDYYRLALEVARATYNITAGHPLFLHWMEFPEDEIQSYVEGGWKYFFHATVGFFLFQFCFTAFAVVFIL